MQKNTTPYFDYDKRKIRYPWYNSNIKKKKKMIDSSDTFGNGQPSHGGSETNIA